ncbi:MAG TPA: lysylphosphatidylglycerol synthase transmembrane domain-containing protein [Roseiflexaceae bacterium]|nr:lysylphosphatidylglycerol synthase transmembrane domain-containing protein [Roseiflexaceae bacterium]
MLNNERRQKTALPANQMSPATRRRVDWRLAIGILISAGILLFAFSERAWILEALGLARNAQPAWLVLAFAVILVSFLISSQVFYVVLRSLDRRVDLLRLWATAVVAIVTSQLFPAGSVASYAFLLDTFRRRGIAAREAVLVASLEMLSYAGAMVIFSTFGLAYLASRILAADPDGSSLLAPLLAAGIALLLIGAVLLLLTRAETTLTSWLLGIHRPLPRLLRRPYDDTWVYTTVAELMRMRALVAERRGMIALLVAIQLTALSGHSLGLYLVLHSLGATPSFLTVLSAFGIALLTSTVNVLPGGGGTVEAALVAVLTQLGAGAAAIPAAIVFRLLNFWVMLPITAGCYAWVVRGRRAAAEIAVK